MRCPLPFRLAVPGLVLTLLCTPAALAGKDKPKKGQEAATKAVTEDITSEYKSQKACVLQAVIKVKGTVLGEKSAKLLHDKIWREKDLAPYRQYSDDAVSPKFFAHVGLASIPQYAGKLAHDVADEVAAGTFVVVLGGSGEDHVVVLEKAKKTITWLDYEQIKGTGFKEAKIGKDAKVLQIYK
jgi:hypothetical protein